MAFRRFRLPTGAIAAVACLSCGAVAQEPSPLATATAMQRLIVQAIERAENSVVAIARVRRDPAQPITADLRALLTIAAAAPRQRRHHNLQHKRVPMVR